MKNGNHIGIFKLLVYIFGIIMSFVAGYFTNITYAKVRITDIEKRTDRIERIVDTKFDEITKQITDLKIEVAKLRTIIEKRLVLER